MLNTHNRILLLSFISLVIVLTSFMVILVTSEGYVDSLYATKTNVYGSFSHVGYAYDNTSFNEVDNTLGVIGVAKVNELSASLGYYDKTACSLANNGLKLTDLPDEEQVILSQSVYDHFYADTSVGEVIQVLGKPLKLTKVIPNYGFLWVKGEREIKQEIVPPEIIVNSATFQSLIDEQSVVQMLLFADNQAMQPYAEQISIIENRSINLDSERALFGFHDTLIKVVFVLCIVLIVFILVNYRYVSLDKYAIFNELGLLAKDIHRYMVLEFVMIILTALLFAAGLSFAITVIILNMTNVTMPVIAPAFVHTLLLLGLAAAIATVLSLLRIKNQLKTPNFMLFKRLNKRKLFLQDLFSVKYRLMMFAILVVVLSALFSYIFSEYESVIEAIATTDPFGRMSRDYDMSVQIKKTQYEPGISNINGVRTDNSQNDIAYFGNFYGDEQITQSMLARIQTDDNIDKVSIYREDYYNTYTAITDQILQTDYINPRFSDETAIIELNKLFPQKIDAQLAVHARLIAYPTEDIEQFKQYFDDLTDWQSVLDGRSVLLVLPAYKMVRESSVTPEGNISSTLWWESVPDTDSEAISLVHHYRTGQPHELLFISAKERVNGALTQEEVEKHLSIQSLNTTIAGVTSADIGWFDGASSIPRAFNYIVSEKFLSNHQVFLPISRVLLRAKSSADTAMLDEAIVKATNNSGELTIINRRDNLQTLHDYRIMQGLFKLLLLFTFIVIAFSVANTVYHLLVARLSERFQVYGLLGVTERQSKKRLFSFLTLSLLPPVVVIVYLIIAKRATNNPFIDEVSQISDQSQMAMLFIIAFYIITVGVLFGRKHWLIKWILRGQLYSMTLLSICVLITVIFSSTPYLNHNMSQWHLQIVACFFIKFPLDILETVKMHCKLGFYGVI